MAKSIKHGVLFKSDSIVDIELYTKPVLTVLEHVPFAILYAVALYYCVISFGVPFQV